MYISARERKILDLLLAHPKGITVKDVAKQLDVSERTVHRDLKGVEQVAEAYNLQLIKKAGVGIQIVGDEEKKHQLQMRVFRLSHTEYTPEERQTMILIALLESGEPVKLISLANDLNVTVATISNDLDKVEEKVEKHGLALVRKRGYGVEIAGSEAAKRKMMSELLFDHFDESQFFSFMKESIQKKSTDLVNTVTEKLLGLVDKKKLFMIERQIEAMKDDLPFTIADSSYIALVIHLALAIERIMQGEAIHFDAQHLQTISMTKEYETAEKIAKRLEEVFHLVIPKEEIGYITMHLMGAKLRTHRGYMLEEASLEIAMKTQELIRFVSEQIGVDLTDDYPLYEDLIVHLKPALYRIQHHMGITNPLLHKIMEDYSELFHVVQRGVRHVFSDMTVPEEEVGYLVLHFASALLRDKQGIRALVICSSGIGTAKILATRLKKEIPDISHIEQKSFFDVQRVDVHEYDLIVSTVPIHTSHPYFLVNPMLPEEEVTAIRQFLKTKAFSIRSQKVNSSKKGIENIRSIHVVSETIVHLLNGFSMRELSSYSLQDALMHACAHLEQHGVIRNKERVVEELLQREQVGGLGIPNTTLALYHTRSEDVLQPSFTMYTLTHPQTIVGMDQQPMMLNRLLLLLAPKNAPDDMLQVLSHVSSLIIKDEESMELFSKGSKEQIYAFFSAQLEKFFYEQIQQHKE
ncbi:BglG family transcription antiterminator [Anoxybacillus flavithermus]|uniref:Transcriptional antiterminator of mannitol metabolism n=1 Tax=Anoxybacillus flavithermus (strain DSM 21510 / WK1) TaxID=491915 RepID=B7GJR6_ANOFW|nr:BglG family transcription antiterminator [Anoxybacillus flavithermus]ACJ33929.1 Transcriptional antiterminator of mannitol metabolism [Anoxybacillus flavithermus WK1]